MEKMYGMLPLKEDEIKEVKEGLESKLTLKTEKLKKFMSLPINERAREAHYTEDQELLNGIIKGEFDERSWSVTGPALQNKNIPREFLEDVLLKYSGEYSLEAKLWAASNTGLSSKDVGHLYLTSEEIDIKAVSLLNKNLDKRFISGVLKKLSFEDICSYPNCVIFLDESNNHIPIVQELRKRVESSKEYKDSYSKAESIKKKYMRYEDKKSFSIFSGLN